MTMKRYTFRGVLALEGALHIGSGGGASLVAGDPLVDATIVRDGAGRAYIPGSSLRGVLRTAIGAYASQLDLSELRDDAVIAQSVKDKLTDPATGNALRLSEQELQTALNDPEVLTPAERLFGTVFWASPLLIPDLHLVDGANGDGEVRHGVAIDRDTGAALDGAKYDFEVLSRASRFAFLATLEISDASEPYETEWLQLMAVGIGLLERGDLRLGGRLARGVGQVKLEGLTVSELDMGNRTQLLGFLKGTAHGVTTPGGWVAAQLNGIK